MIGKPSTTTAIKLGSIVVHADELLDGLAKVPIPSDVQFDYATLRTMIADPAVQDWLRTFSPGLLPVKRS